MKSGLAPSQVAMESCFAPSQRAEVNPDTSMSNSSTSELKTPTIEREKSTLEIETDAWNKSSLSLPTSKKLQNDIDDLFRSQQKSPTSSARRTQHVFSSPDALVTNPSANWRNANANVQSTRTIVGFKGMKKRKAMESSQKEVRVEDSTSRCYGTTSKDILVKRLRAKVEFAVNQLRLAIPEQEEAINHSLTYIRKACGENIENPIQEQINLLQSQTNKKLETILQLVQQNAQNIEKESRSKQTTKNAQTSQAKQSSQMPQDMQASQRLTQKSTYAQKAAQFAGANANANANAGG